MDPILGDGSASSAKKQKSSRKEKKSKTSEKEPDPNRLSLLMSNARYQEIKGREFHYDQELFAPIAYSDMHVL